MAHAAVVTTFYGDDDGFGIGAVGTLPDADSSNAEPGEAPLTDVRLIGTAFAAPPFTPTGSFDPFSVSGTILSATLTLSLGAFVSMLPVNGPNSIVLDGLTVDPSFIDSFGNGGENNIDTLSIALDAAFFALLADGNVSLNGTRISEGSGFGSFQVDFLRLDIVTSEVPAPAALALFGTGLLGLGLGRSRRR